MSEVHKMIPRKRYLFLSAASAVIVAAMALNVRPQEPAGGYRPNPNAPRPTPYPTPAPVAPPDLQPMWAVNGMIRWRKAYGVMPTYTNNLEENKDNRCIQFYVAAVDPATGRSLGGDHSQMWK